jgi:hypothetical protein
MKPSSPAGLPPTPDLVPSLDEVVRYFSGALLLMSGKAEGLRRLDLSADGFWQSFSAIVVALPPIALSWIEYEAVERRGPVADTSAMTIYMAHFLADIIGWLLPILVLILAAKRIGYSRKIVPLVVATNWGGAFLAWAFAPYWVLVLLLGASEGTALLGVLVGLASIALTIRLIYFATGKDLGGAFAVAALMVVCSLVSYGAVMDLTGVPLV